MWFDLCSGSKPLWLFSQQSNGGQSSVRVPSELCFQWLFKVEWFHFSFSDCFDFVFMISVSFLILFDLNMKKGSIFSQKIYKKASPGHRQDPWLDRQQAQGPLRNTEHLIWPEIALCMPILSDFVGSFFESEKKRIIDPFSHTAHGCGCGLEPRLEDQQAKGSRPISQGPWCHAHINHQATRFRSIFLWVVCKGKLWKDLCFF